MTNCGNRPASVVFTRPVPPPRLWRRPRVVPIAADRVEDPATAAPRTVPPASATAGVKAPVVRHDGRRWHLWASVHPLDDPEATDRMTTEHATSDDGVEWVWQGTALAGTPGSWDA